VTRPWTPGAVTGVGSLPGTDPREAVALVFGELPDLPHLPELPARGPGAEMVGRTAALLVELPVEIAPSGWRLTGRPGRDLRRARDLLARDLDALEQQASDYRGPLKLQAAGPWTLAASLELASGHHVVSDHGAMRDLTDSLAEGLRVHVADVVSRVPGADVVLQLDEPSLPAVLAGRVATPSGYGTVRSIEGIVAERGLASVLEAVPPGRRVVHCCEADVPLALLRDAGADSVSLDATLLGRAQYDQLGETVDAGVSLWLGVVPATGTVPSFADVRARVDSLWRDLGFGRAELASCVVPTPTCGLAGTAELRRVLSVLRDVGKSLTDED
jgi:hypothetical protein